VDLTDSEWRKGSRSNGQPNCVEVAFAPDTVAVRDSKNPDGPVLLFPSVDWAGFLPS
jgi:hypothetical protein